MLGIGRVLSRKLLHSFGVKLSASMSQAAPAVKLSMTPENAEENLEEFTVPIPAPPQPPQPVHIPVRIRHSVAQVGYIDTGPADGPVCLSLHGANGSFMDMFDIAPSLNSVGVRFIAPEFPGYGNTHLEDESAFDESTEARAELVTNFLAAINVPRVAVVVGHSLGVAVTLRLAANTDTFQSAVSLSGIGISPHKSIRPFWATKAFASLLTNRLTRNATTGVLEQVYAYKGFDTEVAGIGLRTGLLSVAKLNFSKIAADAERIQKKQLPTLFAFTQNDRVIEWKLALKLAQRCGVDMNAQVTWFDSNEEVVRGPAFDDPAVGYPRALVFARGGHFVHRSHLDIVTSAVIQLVQNVVSRRDEQTLELESTAQVHQRAAAADVM